MDGHTHDIVLTCMEADGETMTARLLLPVELDGLFGKSMTDSAAFEKLAQDLSKASKDERAKLAAEILGGHL